mmetsp:Transcript_75464/g.149208  ORF Transcript_75464/g.149208 Transcript_75464/m.149208 type:complete len:219 (-) Transcript_75464:176-832(-)
MLQVYKNDAVTTLVRAQLEIREMELDWYCMNYDTMALQAAMFAGFSFEQITEPVPQDTNTTLEVAYLLLTCLGLGFNMCVCVSCVFCCIFGKGLALRGPQGPRSVHVAVDNLEAEQKTIFTYFVLGILAYLVSNIAKMWIYYPTRIAFTVSLPLLTFFAATLYYVLLLMDNLVLDDSSRSTGRFHLWEPYSNLRDLDQSCHQERELLLSPRRHRKQRA